MFDVKFVDKEKINKSLKKKFSLSFLFTSYSNKNKTKKTLIN